MFVEKHCGPKFKITTDKYTFVEFFVANNYILDRKINWLKKSTETTFRRYIVTNHLIRKGSGVNLIFFVHLVCLAF